jgi:hypothetical protein
LHVRLSQLLEGHKQDLNQLFDLLSEPRRAVDCFEALFNRPIDDNSIGLATGETLAHLNCLLHRGRISRDLDDNGIYWYQQIPETADFD